MQHLWAELSEKFSDVMDPAIKYGGGDETVRKILSASSIMVDTLDYLESRLAGLLERVPIDASEGIEEVRQYTTSLRQKMLNDLRDAIIRVETLRGEQ